MKRIGERDGGGGGGGGTELTRKAELRRVEFLSLVGERERERQRGVGAGGCGLN